MQEPPGYETKEGGPSVKRLLKSLYGLKQAGRKWYEVLRRTLTDLAFHVSDADPGVFHTRIDEHALILAVHVDDCIITGGSIKLIRDYKRKLNKQHALTDLGPIHWLLGIKISRDVTITPYLSRDTTYCYRHCKGISRFPLLLHHPSPRPMPDRTTSTSLTFTYVTVPYRTHASKPPITCTASRTASFL